MLPLKLLELALQEDVRVGIDAPDETDLSLFVRVLEGSAEQLVHEGDAGAAGYRNDVAVLFGAPLVAGDRVGEVERLAGGHGVEVCACFAVGVLLH